MTIQESIRKHREEKGLSQNQLGKRSSVPTTNICYWESGRGDPPISACIKLAKGLGISVSELVKDCDTGQ